MRGGYGSDRFKKLTKRMVQEIASSFSEELSPGFSEEVLEEISSAAHVTTFTDCVAFINTLQRRREEFDSLLQHMSELLMVVVLLTGPNLHLPSWSFPSKSGQGAARVSKPSLQGKTEALEPAARTDCGDYNHCSCEDTNAPLSIIGDYNDCTCKTQRLWVDQPE